MSIWLVYIVIVVNMLPYVDSWIPFCSWRLNINYTYSATHPTSPWLSEHACVWMFVWEVIFIYMIFCLGRNWLDKVDRLSPSWTFGHGDHDLVGRWVVVPRSQVINASIYQLIKFCFSRCSSTPLRTYKHWPLNDLPAIPPHIYKNMVPCIIPTCYTPAYDIYKNI